MENEWIRAIRVTVGPHEKLKMHKHPATGAVVVYLSDQDMRQFMPTARRTRAITKPAQSAGFRRTPLIRMKISATNLSA